MYAGRQLRLAAGTGACWNSRHPLSLAHAREPTDLSPVTRHAERRKLHEARSLRLLSDNFLGNLAIQKTYGFVVRKSAYRYTFGVWPTVKKTTDRVSKMYEMGVL